MPDWLKVRLLYISEIMTKSKQGSKKETNDSKKKHDKLQVVSSTSENKSTTKSSAKKADFENPTDDPA